MGLRGRRASSKRDSGWATQSRGGVAGILVFKVSTKYRHSNCYFLAIFWV